MFQISNLETSGARAQRPYVFHPDICDNFETYCVFYLFLVLLSLLEIDDEDIHEWVTKTTPR